MKIKLDEHITVAALPLLRAAGHDVHTVTDENMAGADDRSLMAACIREQRLLITFDLGFGDVRAYPPAQHPGVLLLRMRDQQPDEVLDLLRKVLAQHDLTSFAGTLAIATSDTVRLRR